MSAQFDNVQDNKPKEVLSNDLQDQVGENQSPSFIDNRPETVFQRKLKENVHKSSHGSQLSSFQNLADTSQQSSKLIQMQSAADNFSRKEAQTIQQKENNLGLPSNQQVNAPIQRQVKSKTENDVTVYVSDLPHLQKDGKPKEFKTEAEALLMEKLNEHYLHKPTEHPEYPEFFRLMTEAGFDVDVTNKIWKLLLDGFKHNQDEVDKQGPQDGLSDEEKKRNKEELKVILNNNVHLTEVKDLMKDYLKYTTAGEGRDLALWSGGYDLSPYAFQRGWAPLERTTFAKIADTLKFHANWQLQAPLWNLLSKAFVEVPSETVHVVLRTYEDQSVLNQKEIPTIQEKHPATKIKFHAIYTHENNSMQEIKPDLSLVEEWIGFDVMLQAITILLEKYRESPNSKTKFGNDQLKKDTDDEVRGLQELSDSGNVPREI